MQAKKKEGNIGAFNTKRSSFSSPQEGKKGKLQLFRGGGKKRLGGKKGAPSMFKIVVKTAREKRANYIRVRVFPKKLGGFSYDNKEGEESLSG